MSESRTVASSRTRTTTLMTPEMANFGGHVHGGHVLRLIDQVAYACAASYSRQYCVTRSVDRVDFRVPVPVGDFLILEAQVNFVGRTSMEIGVRAETRNLRSGETRHTNSCYLTMVALDEETRRPTPVPPLVCETDEDRRRFAEGARRRKGAKLIRLAEESEQRHHGRIEAARVAMLLADAEEGALVDSNRRACELLGRAEGELGGSPLKGLFADPSAGVALWRRAVEEGFAEERLELAGDAPETVEATAWLIPLPGRDLVQVVLRGAGDQR